MNPTWRSAATYLAVVQFFFAACWTVYVIFLPGLLKQVGIDPKYVLVILMLDQLVFVIMDVAMGFFADHVERLLGRLGYWLLGLTAVSCGAFLLLPWLPAVGAPAPLLMLALIMLWAVTSSALRAPPLVLLGKYARTPDLPWLAALNLAGLALAGALSPYLGSYLKNLDPRLPFAISSGALLVTVAGLVWIERGLAHTATLRPPTRPAAISPWFLLGVLALGLAFQIFFPVNTAKLFLQFAKPADLEWLMPIFWIGFNVAIFASPPLIKRYGAVSVLLAAGVVAAAGALGSVLAQDLLSLSICQGVTGAAWAGLFAAGIAWALEQGASGAEGRYLGLLFSMLALAALGRMAAVWLKLPQQPEIGVWLQWLPVGLWLGGCGLVWAAAQRLPAGNRG